MKPTGIPAMPIDLDPDADRRIAISLLLDRRRLLWNQRKPWVNEHMHGAAEQAEQDRVCDGLTIVRLELLALGYEDQFCQP